MRKPSEWQYFAVIFSILHVVKGFVREDVAELLAQAPRSHHFVETAVVGFEDALYEYEIVPDILEDAPPQVIMVMYGDALVNLGKKLKLLDIMVPPTYVEWDHEKDKLYTLIMASPDYPYKMQHQYREYPHWVVGNIPGDSFLAGTTVFEYKDPPKTYEPGTKRMVFIVYKQNSSEPLQFDELTYNAQNISLFRRNFRTDVFSRKYKLGAPIAANFFLIDL